MELLHDRIQIIPQLLNRGTKVLTPIYREFRVSMDTIGVRGFFTLGIHGTKKVKNP